MRQLLAGAITISCTFWVTTGWSQNPKESPAKVSKRLFVKPSDVDRLRDFGSVALVAGGKLSLGQFFAGEVVRGKATLTNDSGRSTRIEKIQRVVRLFSGNSR